MPTKSFPGPCGTIFTEATKRSLIFLRSRTWYFAGMQNSKTERTVSNTSFYRLFHTRNESWVIRTGCALVTTSGWLDAKIFKIFQNFGPIVSRHQRAVVLITHYALRLCNDLQIKNSIIDSLVIISVDLPLASTND